MLSRYFVGMCSPRPISSPFTGVGSGPGAAASTTAARAPRSRPSPSPAPAHSAPCRGVSGGSAAGQRRRPSVVIRAEAG